MIACQHPVAAIYHCPADRVSVLGLPQVPRTRSYMMNAWLNGSTRYFPRPWNRTHYTSLQKPAQIFALLDAGTIDSGSFYFWPVGSEAWIDNVPSDRHLQASNFSFADGHVE